MFYLVEHMLFTSPLHYLWVRTQNVSMRYLAVDKSWQLFTPKNTSLGSAGKHDQFIIVFLC